MKNKIQILSFGLSLSCALIAAQQPTPAAQAGAIVQQQPKPTQQPVAQPVQQQEGADPEVVFGHLANIFIDMATFAQNPQNPAPVASALGNLVKIIAQIVKSLPAGSHITDEDIARYFAKLYPQLNQDLCQVVRSHLQNN